MSRLMSVENGTSAQTVAKILNVLFPDAQSVLDMTYGSGKFWTASHPWRVTGIDLDQSRARDVCADFTRLPFTDGAFDVAIFDPPYLTECSKKETSRMGNLFSFFPSIDALRDAVALGTTEAWRVSRVGVIAKVQNYSHSGRSVRMTRWVEDAIPETPYGEIHALGTAKIVPAAWGRQLSVWSVHTTYLAFRHGSQMHVWRDQRDAVDAPLVPVQQQLALDQTDDAGRRVG